MNPGSTPGQPFVEYLIDRMPPLPMPGTVHVPRVGELVHFLTGEAPRSVYRVADVTHLISKDGIRVQVVLS